MGISGDVYKNTRHLKESTQQRSQWIGVASVSVLMATLKKVELVAIQMLTDIPPFNGREQGSQVSPGSRTTSAKGF